MPSDLFSETTNVCPVCGGDCIGFLSDNPRLPHANERKLVPHIIAPHDVFSEPNEYGGGRKLIAAGDPVSPETAAKYGWTSAPVGPGLPHTIRRRPPEPRVAVDS